MKILLMAVILAFGISMLTNHELYCQENKEEPPPTQETQMTAPSRPAQVSPSTTVEEAEKPMEAAKPEEMSIYGEVKSTDSAANSVKLRYYDYDSDEEKTEEIILDRSTKMENAAGLQDIKEGDWIDAVYVPKGGKNIAKSVIVEKEEEEPADVAGTKPEGKSAETPPMME